MYRFADLGKWRGSQVIALVTLPLPFPLGLFFRTLRWGDQHVLLEIAGRGRMPLTGGSANWIYCRKPKCTPVGGAVSGAMRHLPIRFAAEGGRFWAFKS